MPFPASKTNAQDGDIIEPEHINDIENYLLDTLGLFIDEETPTGLINGVNTAFVLANTPKAGTTKVYLNGVRMSLTEDYSLVTATITFTSAPPTGSILRVDYRY